MIYVGNMSEKHERLRQARIDAGYRYASDAANALGVTASTYRAHENGQNDFDLDYAKMYGKKFGVNPLWIFDNQSQESVVADTSELPNINPSVDLPNASIRGRVEGEGKRIPVFGQAVGGVDGEFIMNGNILYEVMAPPVISHISKAYAVAVSGESMYPRYEDGEICFIDPSRRVKKGDYVVAQIRAEMDGNLLAYVKKFVRWNSEELVLEQFNPAKELRFNSKTVHSVHYIALAGVA